MKEYTRLKITVAIITFIIKTLLVILLIRLLIH